MAINSFADRDVEKLFNDKAVRRFQSIEHQARKRLHELDKAKNHNDLMKIPANKFHALSGDRKGQYAVSINKQWRICFKWQDGNAYDVEIVNHYE
jgi:proteic killer suppression protein